MCAIFFATIVNQPIIPSTFIFQLLEEFAVGIAIAVLVSLTVFPMFATLDIENRVDYCLVNLQQMQTVVIQAFLRDDQISAQVNLTRAATIEQMVRTALGPIHTKLIESRFEPSRCLQWIFNRRRKHLNGWTVHGQCVLVAEGMLMFSFAEQDDLITSWFMHVRAMQSMVKQCQFNGYHRDFAVALEESLSQLSAAQSAIVTMMTSSSSMTEDVFNQHLSNLAQTSAAFRMAYTHLYRQRIEHALESATAIRSEDHLPHAFFLFQINTIVELFERLSTRRAGKPPAAKKTRKTLKERMRPNWTRLFSALKCTIIIGVGSIFVMVPALATAFENGQWIFVALCMTQGDSVGGAFTTMKMRLLGTLLGERSPHTVHPSSVMPLSLVRSSRSHVGLHHVPVRRRQRLSDLRHAGAMDSRLRLRPLIDALDVHRDHRHDHAHLGDTRSLALRQNATSRQLHASAHRRKPRRYRRRHRAHASDLSRLCHRLTQRKYSE